MFESISQALQGVFSHKMRSFLTMLGIIIGIASIITIISGIKGTNEQIKANLIGAGNNVVTVQLYQNDMQYEMMYSGNPVGVKPLDAAQRDELRKLDGVDDVTFYHSRSYAEQIYYQNTAFNGNVYGIDDSYFAVNDYQIKQGRGFSQEDQAQMHKVVILDERAVQTLFGSENPVGKVVEIMKEPFRIVGVAARSSSFEPVINTVEDYYSYAQTDAGSFFLPDSTWPIVYRFDEPQSVAVRASSTDDMTNAGKAVADYLNENQIAQQASQNGMSYRSNDLLKRAQQLQELSSSTNNQLIWIAAISLLVGGIGVMNIMLVSVTERTHEIGLRKAIGAKRRRILTQFLTEAAVLTGIGGVLGVLAGIGMSKLISKFMDTPSAISVPAIAAATVFSILIGLIFGLVPAVKASKLNPIEALRRE
ncbi:MAG: ABC transporter permease [Oscillospiraceae bacterium]|nr:ABC transporter permease [Oscillospiraceae bacterium]